jgi:phosphopantothenoylcysteine decarboxylase/phosphopantothenate--cysteine ligase
MTGSIACYKACNIISILVQAGHQVQVAASSAALKFIGSATLEGLTGNPVQSDLWASGQAMDHIHLVRWADLILMAPASANSINKIAHGVGDDLVTTLFLAHDFKRPLLIAPAMNTSMYLHPVTQVSLQKLRKMGVQILETASGVLACGEVGYGKLLDPELILAEVHKHLGSQSVGKQSALPKLNPIKVLITSGGTTEPLDDVRVLTNRSTGATGARLAERLFDFGFDVTFLHSKFSKLPERDVQTKSFITFEDLSQSLRDTLQSSTFGVVIHAAAVGDFSLEKPTPGGKLSSDENLTLKFKKNPKLVNQIKSWSKGAKLIAFKMTSTAEMVLQKLAIEKLFTDSSADIVIHNDVSEIDWQNGKHLFHWHTNKADFSENIELENSDQLAERLAENLFESFSEAKELA